MFAEYFFYSFLAYSQQKKDLLQVTSKQTAQALIHSLVLWSPSALFLCLFLTEMFINSHMNHKRKNGSSTLTGLNKGYQPV